jgi:hypothetical protein
VAQGVGPELKPQYCTKEKKKAKGNIRKLEFISITFTALRVS